MCACFDKLLFGAVEGGKEPKLTLSDFDRKIRYPFGYLIFLPKFYFASDESDEIVQLTVTAAAESFIRKKV